MSATDSKTVLTVVFSASLVTANIIAAKLAFFQIPLLGGVAVPAGFVAIGVGFLCTDLLGELHGREAARKAVNATVIALLVVWGLIYMAVWMPVAPFYEAHDAYVTTLSASGTIVTASILTTLVSQNVDVEIFHRVDTLTDGRHAWARNLSSTGLSQLVDTTLFIVLGFVVLPQVMGGTTTPLAVVPSLILGQYVVKLVVAVLDTPVFYAVRRIVE
jgi:uncharacterized integral membrane protein (TIGR00697 family)